MFGWLNVASALGFPIEPFGEADAAAAVGRQDSERDLTVERGLAGAMDRAHAAGADRAGDLEPRRLDRVLPRRA